MEEIKNDIVMNGQRETVLFQDACQIIEQAQAAAYRAVDVTLIKRNWLLGMRINMDILKAQRAEYGDQIIKTLAKSLTMRYGEGFTKTNLYNYIGFYQKWPEFFHAVSGQSDDLENIFHAVSGKSENIMQLLIATSPIRLSWTHYRIILQESNKEARDWYEQEAAREMWGTRTLQRNVSSQYYHRLLQSQNKDAVRGEMKLLTAPLQDKLEYIKNPVVAEFLGFKNRTEYTERKRIHTEKEDYYIDMVFYNYNLRSFILIDLKTTKLCHQDVGQMDMYVRMYDEMMCPQGHNPTIGLILCADTDDDVAHYSVLNGSDQLFAAKYLTYMPSRADLRREIEQQKEFFLLQHKK